MLAAFWAAIVYKWLRPSSTGFASWRGFCRRSDTVLNLSNFHRVNEVVKILHNHPLVRLNPPTFDPRGIADRFEALLKGGRLPQANGFRSLFSYYRDYPVGDESYAGRLLRAYNVNPSH